MQLRTLTGTGRTCTHETVRPRRPAARTRHSAALSAHLSTSSTQVGVTICLRFLAFSEQGLVMFLM